MSDLKDTQPTGESAKERSDKPMTSAEMAEKNKELKVRGYKLLSLENYCVTPKAQDWLIAQGMADTKRNPANPKAGFNYRLRFMVLKGRALNLGRQLTLTETQEAATWLQSTIASENGKAEELKKLRDVHTDETVNATVLTDGKVTCDIGEEEFEPMSWTAVKGDKPVIDSRTGQPFRSGNFFVLPNEDGTFRVGAIGRCCVDDYRGTLSQGTDPRLFHSHTYAEAVRIANDMTVEVEKVKMEEDKRRAKLAKLGSNVNAMGEVNRSAKLGFGNRRRGNEGGYRR